MLQSCRSGLLFVVETTAVVLLANFVLHDQQQLRLSLRVSNRSGVICLSGAVVLCHVSIPAS